MEAKPTETPPQKPKKTKLAIFIITLLIVATLSAGIAGYYIGQPKNSNQQSSVTNQQAQSSTGSISQASVTLPANASLSQIYHDVAPSVVVVEDFQPSTDLFGQTEYSQVQGSGFTYDLNGQ